MKLQDKVAIITGAASGMGEAMAYAFARNGAKVVITDIQLEKLNGIVTKLKTEGLAATAVKHDVSSKDAWQSDVIPAALNAYGKVDVLVNNAGISIPTPFDQQTEDIWAKAYAINLNSVMLGMQSVLPHMKENGGSIVNISSIAALTGMSGAGAYTASKGAVSAITRAAAVDYGKMNIRVNAINPGYILTPMSAPHLNNPDYKEYFLNLIPMKALGAAEDISNAALFLASDDAKYITGINLPIDGGVVAK